MTGNAVDKQRFGLNKGRQRPVHKARQIKCKNCGAALSVKDERSELLVCDYCNSMLDISSAEQRVLGQQREERPDFSLEVGDSYRLRAARYEVIGRIALIEGGDSTDMTMEYLLYHPCRGSMWLGEYKGIFSLTSVSHVMPRSLPKNIARGDVIMTWDNKRWVNEGTGVYKVYYVDGALPWQAKTGDKISYMEFAEQDGSGRIYEINSSNLETEYSAGKRLDLKTVRAATGKLELGLKTGVEKVKGLFTTSDDSAVKRKNFRQTIFISAAFAFINFMLFIYCMMAGDTVLNQGINAADLTKGTYTKPFTIQGLGKATKINFLALMNNSWMSLETMLVKDQDRMIHDFESNMEFYSGVEGGESWSEGNREESLLVKIPDPGTYRLFVQGVSAKGNTSKADKALHGINVTVIDGAQPWVPFLLASIMSMILLIVTAILYSSWKTENN